MTMSTLRKLACAFLLVLAASAPAAAVERILSFVSDVAVQRNGDLDVTETIRVQAEGNEIRRGILRDFPTIYTPSRRDAGEVGFSVQSVTRDGAAEKVSTETLSNGVRVRIGNADVTLPTGPHQYVIKYRTTRQIGFFADYDELYWNATGNGWTFAIDQAEARITLPAEVPFKQTAFYTGPQGAQGKDATIVEQKPGHIVFRTTRPLPARSGLTVAAAWEKGLVAPPTGAQKAGYFLEDNLAIALAVVGPRASSRLLRLRLEPGRPRSADRNDHSFVRPAAGFSPAATRYVDRMGFDDRCFAVSIIDLGVNGHLKIDGAGKNPVIRQQSGGRAVTAEENAMEHKLFQGMGSIELVQANHEILGKAKTALAASLQQAYRRQAVQEQLRLVRFRAGAHDPVRAGGADRRGRQPQQRSVRRHVHRDAVQRAGRDAGRGDDFQRIAARAWRRLADDRRRCAGGAGCCGRPDRDLVQRRPDGGFRSGARALCGRGASAGVGILWLKAATPAGRKTMDDIEGFRQYLGVAEEDRLNAMNPPDKTPELFEKFLPYAVALDCHNAWAKRFAGVLAAAGTAAVVQLLVHRQPVGRPGFLRGPPRRAN